MKEGFRFVDCDMHIQEPPDLFERYLDPAYAGRVTSQVGPDGSPRGGWLIDGIPLKPRGRGWRRTARPTSTAAVAPFLSHSREGGRGVGRSAHSIGMQRGFDAASQVIAMDLEGIDIAVLYPTIGLFFMARDNLDPQLSLAICRAYNDYMHDFCRFSPDQLKFAAMLPVHEVNLACRELVRCVTELGAVGSFVRPNPVNGHYWHTEYWEPLYRLHEELDVTWGFHEGAGSWYSQLDPRFDEARMYRGYAYYYRHVISHPLEMQMALAAQLIGGVFEFYPRLRVGYLEAQSWWAPGLLSRIEWDYANDGAAEAPYLTLRPIEYFRRNCWAAVEGSEPEVVPTAAAVGGDRLCISTDYPHVDSNFPNVSSLLLRNAGREIGGQILGGGAGLYGFGEGDFQKADAAMAAFRQTAAYREAQPLVEAFREEVGAGELIGR
jgi:predicted TIM-barrel fold metal-dependent hydrolase